MLRHLLILLLALLPLPASDQEADFAPLAGSWALEIGRTPIFRYDLASGAEGWSASWWRPKSFASDGNSFSRVTGPAVEVVSSNGKADGEWVELTFPDARPGAVPDVFRLRLIAPDRAEMIYVDTHLAPFTLVRVKPGAELGPWDTAKVYRRVSVESLGLPADPKAVALVSPGDAPQAGSAPATNAPAAPQEAPVYSLPAGAKPIEGR